MGMAMTRRSLSPKQKKRIANGRRWWVKEGGLLCLERGNGLIRKVVFLATGKRPEWDHNLPLADGGGNEDDNFQPMSPEAHQEKTNAEARARGKVRRLSGQTKPKWKRSWPKGRKLGIPGWRKKLNGKVERCV